jgi:transcriptional regulator with XRE-family HTH domain
VSTPIGKKIRNIRETLGMGRQEFAEKTGIIKGTLIRIEVSDSEPRSGVLIAIAQAWPEYAAYLLTDESHIKQRNPEVEGLAEKLQAVKKAS